MQKKSFPKNKNEERNEFFESIKFGLEEAIQYEQGNVQDAVICKKQMINNYIVRSCLYRQLFVLCFAVS